MNKKIISLTLILAMIFTGTYAYALDASLTGDVITISGSGFGANDKIPVVITKPGVDASGLSDGNIKEGVIFAYEATAAPSGELSLKVRLPLGSPAGWYTARAGAGSDGFYYATEQEIDSAVSAFAGASESSIGGVIRTYSIDKPIVYLDLNGIYAQYTSYVQKLFVTQLDVDVPQSIADIQNTYSLSLDIAAFAKEGAAAVEALLGDAAYSSYVDAVNSAADVSGTFVNLRPSEIYTMSELTLAMRKANALAALSGADRTKVMGIAADYNDVLALDLSGDYLKCDSLEVAKVLAGQDFTSIEAVRKAFADRVSELTAPKPGKTSGSSGGSGGASFSAQLNNESANPPSSSATDSLVFSDMKDYEWASSYVTALSKIGVVNGIGGGLFDPAGYVTREQYVKMLALAFKASVSAVDCAFTDVVPGSWYADYVAWGNANGIVTGVSPTEFGVGRPITREDMCTVTYRALNSMQITLERGTLEFDDSDCISAYASDAVAALTASGVISGRDNGSFAPGDCCNRAEAAKVVYLIMQKAGVLNG